MTDEQIEKIAQRVAKLILTNLHDAVIPDMYPDREEDLLAELARCMTLLNRALDREDYEKCEILKNKIRTIENKLKNL